MRRESITCKAQTPDILSFFVAFTSNMKSRPVINILWHLFLVACDSHCFTCRAKLSTSQYCSRLACAIYSRHWMIRVFERAKVRCFGWRSWSVGSPVFLLSAITKRTWSAYWYKDDPHLHVRQWDHRQQLHHCRKHPAMNTEQQQQWYRDTFKL